MNFKNLKRRNTLPKESVVVLFGNPTDPEVKTSINKIAIVNRKTEVVARPAFESGMGRCGKHLCSCKTHCMASYNGQAYTK